MKGGLTALCVQILHTQTPALFSIQVTPLTALKFAELTLKAGIPKGVVNILPGSGKDWGEERARAQSIQVHTRPEQCGKGSAHDQPVVEEATPWGDTVA